MLRGACAIVRRLDRSGTHARPHRPGDPPAPLQQDMEKNLTAKKNVCFRLSESDIDILDSACEDLGISRTRYFEYLIRMPLASKGARPPFECIVLDNETFAALKKELIRWGYHYNQAVRSLNAIALYLRQGQDDTEWFREMIAKAADELEAVNAGRGELSSKIDELKDSVLMGGS